MVALLHRLGRSLTLVMLVEGGRSRHRLCAVGSHRIGRQRRAATVDATRQPSAPKLWAHRPIWAHPTIARGHWAAADRRATRQSVKRHGSILTSVGLSCGDGQATTDPAVGAGTRSERRYRPSDRPPADTPLALASHQSSDSARLLLWFSSLLVGRRQPWPLASHM
jgi:hypothetical protein